ncbi:DMT family transporter [Salarchaeum sp. JOR-1]|uniref:DMT family transporter n=1 Tax=Salarchaeum sp. JOR-1 TaxID=2599399 RepID=UPI00119885B7|nr:DMT family transporter [Salarchaeum sp. JOR-1]QDX41874.1 DMT family transporter [Salarchaeum sp. JOR-1]
MSRYRNLSLFLVLAAAWGAAFMAIKAGLAYFPPVLFAAVRYDVAGVLMCAYAWYATDHPRPESRGEWLLVGVGATFIIAGYHAFLFVGETSPEVSSAAAAVVVSLSPVLTTGFSRGLLPSERLAPAGVLGLLFGLAGVVVLATGGSAALGDVGSGEALVFAAAACFALGSVLTERIDASLPIETMEGWSMLLGALLMHAASLAVGEPLEVRWTWEAVAALAYLSLAASALGFLIYFDLLDRLGPIQINLVSYVAPVFAAITGFLVLGEELDWTTGAGFLVIFAGFCLVKRRAIRDELASWRT